MEYLRNNKIQSFQEFGWDISSQLRSPDEVDCDEKLMQTTCALKPGKIALTL